jgi:hypothetical protein
MQEQLIDQLTAVLQERANLSPEQARQAAQAAAEFAQQHLPELLQLAQERTGIQLPAGLNLGGLFGGQQPQ